MDVTATVTLLAVLAGSRCLGCGTAARAGGRARRGAVDQPELLTARSTVVERLEVDRTHVLAQVAGLTAQQARAELLVAVEH